MPELKQSMKLSLILGFSGAVIMPLIYEWYANVSRGMGLFFMAVWTVFCGAKYTRFAFKEAALGISCHMAYSGVMGWMCWLLVHPRVVDMLIERSVYFQLTLKEQAVFLLAAFLLHGLMYVVWLAGLGLKRLKRNRDLAGSYIDNAFDDKGDEP